MKITYTNYRPLAYWKWETKFDAALPPIPEPSEDTTSSSSSEDETDSDLDDTSMAGPSVPSRHKHAPSRPGPLCPPSKAAKLARRAERLEKAKAQARRQAGEGSGDDGDDEDSCGICQEAFEAACPACRMPGDECPLMYGKCTHVFHMHCILTWLADDRMARGKCPLDRRPFETAEQAAPPAERTQDEAIELSDGSPSIPDDSMEDSVMDTTRGSEPQTGEETRTDLQPAHPASSPDPLAIHSPTMGYNNVAAQHGGYEQGAGRGLGIDGHGQGGAYEAIARGNESRESAEEDSMELD